MATITVGQILNETSTRLQVSQKDVLQYLMIFIPATAVASFLDTSLGLVQMDPSQTFQRQNGAIGLIVAVVSIIFQYRLFSAMLGKDANSSRYRPFIGLAILSFLGVGLATLALIIPGLIVGARWLMSPSIFSGEDLGVMDSLGESWTRTKGNTQPVIWAVLLVILAAFVAGVVLGGISLLVASIPLVTDLVDAALSEAASVVIIGLSVAVYGLLGGKQQLAGVFE
jgi:hypothetical protein